MSSAAVPKQRGCMATLMKPAAWGAVGVIVEAMMVAKVCFICERLCCQSRESQAFQDADDVSICHSLEESACSVLEAGINELTRCCCICCHQVITEQTGGPPDPWKSLRLNISHRIVNQTTTKRQKKQTQNNFRGIQNDHRDAHNNNKETQTATERAAE